MKTLDEVVHALEVCTSGYCSNHDGDCPYLGHYKCNDEQRKLDELFYLKEYKANQEDPDGDHQQLEKAQKLLWEFYQNDPLTWDELKQMEGKPVWVELLDHDIWEDPSHRVDSEWWVIGEVRKADIIAACYLDEIELCEEDLGKTWQAYRKERE